MKNLIIISAITITMLTACKQPGAEASAAGDADTTAVIEKEPIAVEAIIASQSEVARQIKGGVTVAGIRELFLPAKSGGTLTSVPVKMGDRVKRGSTILTVESYVQKAALEKARVSVQEAALNFNAVEKLYEKKSVSEAEYIKAKGILSAAQAGFEMSRFDYRNCRLRAPFGGAVTYLDPIVQKGNVIAAGSPMVRMVDIGKLKMNLYLGEAEIAHVHKGNHATVTVSAVNTELEGTVTAVAEGSDPSTGSFMVEVVCDNPGELVKAGMTAVVTVDSDERNSGVIIPSSALILRGGNAFVMSVEDDVAKAVQVSEYRLLRGNRYLIESDIDDYDILIITGLTKLSSGDPVTVSVVDKN